MAEQEALLFIDTFPEALTFNVTVLSADKSIKFVHMSQCFRRLLLDKQIDVVAIDASTATTIAAVEVHIVMQSTFELYFGHVTRM